MTRLSKNIIYNLLGQGLVIILSFVAVKYIFTHLGKDALGIIFFTQTLTLVLRSVLDLGIGSTTVREVAAHRQNEPEYIDALLRTDSAFYWVTYLLQALAIYFSAPLLMNRWVILTDLDAHTAIYALRVLGISAILAFPRTFYISILRGVERMEFNNGIDVATIAFQQLGTIVILRMHGGLIQVSYWLAGCFGLGVFAYLVICARFFTWSALLPGFSAEVFRRNWRLTCHMASISLLSVIQTQTDKAIASKLLPLGIFGYYSIAYGMASRGTSIVNSIAEASLPSLSSAFGTGGQDNLMSRYRKLQDLLSYGSAPVFAGILFAALPVFSYVLNSDAATQLLLPTTFLCVGFLLNASLNAPYMFTIAVGRPDITARSNFYALFVVSPITCLLVFFWGIKGAAFSWIVYHIFAYAYQGRRTCQECLHISTWRWLAYPLQTLVLASFTYGAAWTAVSTFSSPTVVPLTISYVAATVVFLIAAYYLIGEGLRQTFNNYLRKAPLVVTEAR